MAVTVASAILAFLKVALFRELLVGSSLKASSARFTAKTNSSFRRRNSSVASGVIIHSPQDAHHGREGIVNSARRDRGPDEHLVCVPPMAFCLLQGGQLCEQFKRVAERA
jgi:hypothetical protein